jgi:maltooligosyltrehalose trehalohydrolase
MHKVSDAPPIGQSFRTLGALHDGAATSFRVWAPDCRTVELAIDGRLHALLDDGQGFWSGRFDGIAEGSRYKYRLDGDAARIFPDPASRFQPDGVHGPSAVVDPWRFQWKVNDWPAARIEQMVIYELHVGTFSPDGTYRGVVDRLPHLAELGVTAIELMPLADFPGERNWGYDGVALFAPARCYGTPDDLRELVDAAHGAGLSVLLDVVYNHFGPDGAYANAFSPYYFTDRHESPWGRGVNLDGPHNGPVRRFFIENALHWIQEYRFDGLRLDATHAMQDDSPRHFLEELTSTVREEAARPVVVIAEDYRNLALMIRPPQAGGLGLDAVWADDFHHEARVHTAGDREGYYADYTGTAGDLAETIRRGWFFTGQRSEHLGQPRGTDPSGLPLHRFVICTQNHDQIGNRADGARLHHEIDPAVYRAVQTLLLLSPETPLLFMGQEWATTAPFLFFTDHEPELGRRVTEGRRAEFKAFRAFAEPAGGERIPDPQDAATFERSRPRWHELTRAPHARIHRLHRRLLEIRNRTFGARPAVIRDVRSLDEHTVMIAYESPSLFVVARLSGRAGTVSIPVHDVSDVILTTEDPDFVEDPLQPEWDGTAIAFRREGAVIVRGLPLAAAA